MDDFAPGWNLSELSRPTQACMSHKKSHSLLRVVSHFKKKVACICLHVMEKLHGVQWSGKKLSALGFYFG
jgi:hypothetical protein